MPLFAPLIAHLRSLGWQIRVTARDFAQTLDLVEQFKLDAVAVGSHAGRNKLKKVANLPVRALQLRAAVRSFAPQVALSHGSRTQAIASRLMGIPQIVMFDYEWTEMMILERLASLLLCPRAITTDVLAAAGIPSRKVDWYDGFKEEIYLSEFVPDPSFRDMLGVGMEDRLITVRPPGLIGNYHDAGSEEICRRVLSVAASDPLNHLVILPKTRLERALVAASLPANPAARITIPERALPGLQLLYHSDLAISGGGTMNRESALLGVPTYSMFTGRRAAVDSELARRGLLRFLVRPEDVDVIDWRPARTPRAAPHTATVLYEISRMIHKFVGSSARWRARLR